MDFGNQYLSYDEYIDLGGTLEEMPFNILEFKARKIVDDCTFGRLMKLSEQIQEVKMCIYDLISILNETSNLSESNTSKVASESIDGYSVSYKDVDTEEQKKQYTSVVRSYLVECKLEDGTPYMYCGV